jgi:hypothetical protein
MPRVPIIAIRTHRPNLGGGPMGLDPVPLRRQKHDPARGQALRQPAWHHLRRRPLAEQETQIACHEIDPDHCRFVHQCVAVDPATGMREEPRPRAPSIRRASSSRSAPR